MGIFQLEIVTPIKIFDEGQVEYVRCPGLAGSFGVLANHREAIIALGVGEIKVLKMEKTISWQPVAGLLRLQKKKWNYF